MSIYSRLLKNKIIYYAPGVALGVIGGLALGETIAELTDEF